jgi:hypothetical protein
LVGLFCRKKTATTKPTKGNNGTPLKPVSAHKEELEDVLRYGSGVTTMLAAGAF